MNWVRCLTRSFILIVCLDSLVFDLIKNSGENTDKTKDEDQNQGGLERGIV
jgi:hypothetical protein